jgi:hypothetical protein
VSVVAASLLWQAASANTSIENPVTRRLMDIASPVRVGKLGCSTE